jgi:hypothetical protein
MRCLMQRLMLVCAALSLSSCVHTAPPVDSFCQIYNRVVVAKGDGVITATASVKRRLLANELTYRDQCIPKK